MKNGMPPEILGDLINRHSIGILMTLMERNDELVEQVEEIALEFITDIHEDDIGNDLFCMLDMIKVEYIWDHSGGTRDGYVDPNDLAWELFEEEVEPFLKEARKLNELKLPHERDRYFMGILKGLYKFKNESTSSYKDYVPDAPKETFESVVEEWKELSKDPEMVDEYVDENLKGWMEK